MKRALTIILFALSFFAPAFSVNALSAESVGSTGNDSPIIINTDLNSQTGEFENTTVQNAPTEGGGGFLGGFRIGGCNQTGGGGAGAQAASRQVPVNDAQVRTNTKDVRDKECIGDRLQYLISQALIATITDSMISWINNGFDGGPAYVTNYGQLLGGIADNIALNFILGDELSGALCTPFQLPIKQALIQRYQTGNNFSQRISCSLGDLVGPFLGGDFSRGGWNALFRLSLEPQNNPYYAYLSAIDQQAALTQRAQQTVSLSTQSGWRSQGTCRASGFATPGFNPNASAPTTQEVCVATPGYTWNTTMPGQQVSDVVSRTLLQPLEQATVNNELGQSLNSIFGALMQQAFTSFQGLGGLSSRTSSSAFNGQSYLEQLTTETSYASYDAGRSALVNDINGAIDSEREYQSVLNTIVTGYENARRQFEDLKTCAQKAGLSSLQSSANTTLESSIKPILTDYENQRTLSEEVVAELTLIRSQAQSALDANMLNVAGNMYGTLLDSGTLHLTSDTMFLLQERDAQQNTFASYNQQVATGLAQCGGVGI